MRRLLFKRVLVLLAVLFLVFQFSRLYQISKKPLLKEGNLKKDDSISKIFSLAGKEMNKFLVHEYFDVGGMKYYIRQKIIPNDWIRLYETEVEGYGSNPRCPRSKCPGSNGIIIVDLKSNTYYQTYPAVSGGVTFESRYWRDYINDFNKDGKEDIVVSGVIGANIPFREVYSVSELGIEELNIRDQKGDISGFNDLNGDGISELVISDRSWIKSVCWPGPSDLYFDYIYAWKNGGYEDSSAEFPKNFDARIEEEIPASCLNENEFCIGPALKKYFAYKASGEEEKGWKVFLDITRDVSNKINNEEICRNYVIGLHDEGKEIFPPSYKFVQEKRKELGM